MSCTKLTLQCRPAKEGDPCSQQVSASPLMMKWSLCTESHQELICHKADKLPHSSGLWRSGNEEVKCCWRPLSGTAICHSAQAVPAPCFEGAPVPCLWCCAWK